MMWAQRGFFGLALATVVVSCGGAPARMDRQLSRGHWHDAINTGESFAERKDESHDDYGAVVQRLEEARFRAARSEDTVEAYRRFDDRYPDTRFADRLYANLARVEFETNARPLDTLSAYEEFLAEFPTGPYAELARERAAEIAWRAIDDVGQEVAYVGYADTYGSYDWASGAQRKAWSLAWEHAQEDGSPAAYLRLAETYPNAPEADIARHLAHGLAWDDTLGADTVEAYASFRALFPGSLHAEYAADREERLAWLRAEELERAQAYRAFAQTYATSENAEIAEWRAVQLDEFHGANGPEELVATVSHLDPRDPDAVVAYVDVRDANNVLVSGLSQRELKLYENGRAAELLEVVGMERNRPVDIVFAVDVSGSMGDEIHAVRASALTFAQVLRNRQRDVRFGLVSYVEEIIVHNRGRTTSDAREFQQWVADLGILDGQWENPAAAMMAAGSFDFRDDAQRVVILITDEPPNITYDPDLDATPASVARALARDGVTLFAVVPNDPDYTAIEDVAYASRYDIGLWRDAALQQLLLQIADRLSLQYQVVYRSPWGRDAGARRARVRVEKPTLWLPAGTLPEHDVLALLASFDTPCGVLAVLRTAGIWRSTDCAEEWQRIEGADGQYVQVVGKYGDGHILYVLDADGGLWTWSGLDGPLLQRDIALPRVDRIAWSDSRSHEVWAIADGTLYFSPENALGFAPAGTAPGGFLTHSLVAHPHHARACGLTRDGQLACASASGQWTLTDIDLPDELDDTARLHPCPWNENVWFLATGAGVWRSIDRARTWRPVSWGGGVQAAQFGTLYYDEAGRRVCIATDTGVACSDDNGVLWRWHDTRRLSAGVPVFATSAGGGMYFVGSSGGRVQTLAEVTQREFIGNALFAVNEDEPYAEAYPFIEQLGATLAANPSLMARVEGHTDSDGDDDYNLDLSERRAESVGRILVNAGASSGQVETSGFGEQRPIFPNDTNANKQANRRVEVLIVRRFAAN